MRAAIYNPYLDTLGGGELYTISVARVLMEEGYKVDIEWDNPKIKEALENRFGVKLEGIDFVPSINRGDGYDVCFWLSDGSIPILRARNNILHFQFPFKNVGGRTLINKMKLFRIKSVVCNSEFTKGFIDSEYRVQSKVIYPPVNTTKIRSKRKENIILYVGRFSRLTQAKGQDKLIKFFKKLLKKGYDGWRLILAGGTEVGADKYLKRLEEMSSDLPIEIKKSPPFRELKDLYGKAKLFWSASGYGVDEKKDPKRVEHFGITVVEAMSAGAVPLVYSAGGHKEIIKNGENGFLWKKGNSLIEKTISLIEEPKHLRNMSKEAKRTSRKYSYEEFAKSFRDLL